MFALNLHSFRRSCATLLWTLSRRCRLLPLPLLLRRATSSLTDRSLPSETRDSDALRPSSNLLLLVSLGCYIPTIFHLTWLSNKLQEAKPRLNVIWLLFVSVLWLLAITQLDQPNILPTSSLRNGVCWNPRDLLQLHHEV